MTLCDIGNTTFSFFQNGKNFKFRIKEKVSNLPSIKDDIYFVSVNNKARKKFLLKYPNAIDISSKIVFKTKYIGLGLDRQLVCLGIKNGIVIDCGSAITIDIMKKNKHLGGFILSGIKNSIKTYPKISQKLKFNFTNELNLDKIPQNTDEAISYAIIQPIVLLINDIKQKYDLPLYFTGGDAKYLLKYFKEKKYKKNLIFNSMKKLIKEQKC